MITVSSNFAANLLIDRLGAPNVQRTVDGMGGRGMRVRRGVEDSKAFAKGLNNSTTARALMVLMERIGRLEAVDADASRQMIEILKRQRFNDAIPANLPPGTPVAHKTGSITKIHHDAAIVYGASPVRAGGADAWHRGHQGERRAHGPHRARALRRTPGGVWRRNAVRRTRIAVLVALGMLAAGGMAAAQTADYARANYTKYEYRIPMRDGVKLFTAVYVPKDARAGRTRSC